MQILVKPNFKDVCTLMSKFAVGYGVLKQQILILWCYLLSSDVHLKYQYDYDNRNR